MPRAKNHPASRERRRRVLKQTKGYYGGKSRMFRTAKEQLDRSLAYAYRDRRQRKRQFRRLWIARINAASREHGLSYSRLISGLHNANVSINRKVLAELAVNEPTAFAELCSVAKAHGGDGAAAGD